MMGKPSWHAYMWIVLQVLGFNAPRAISAGNQKAEPEDTGNQRPGPRGAVIRQQRASKTKTMGNPAGDQ